MTTGTSGSDRSAVAVVKAGSDVAEAVDLARGFVNCWTYDGPLDAVEEWARQLRDELNRIFTEATAERSHQDSDLGRASVPVREDTRLTEDEARLLSAFWSGEYDNVAIAELREKFAGIHAKLGKSEVTDG